MGLGAVLSEGQVGMSCSSEGKGGKRSGGEEKDTNRAVPVLQQPRPSSPSSLIMLSHRHQSSEACESESRGVDEGVEEEEGGELGQRLLFERVE